MKKFIKIFLVILFIIFILGITTSFAVLNLTNKPNATGAEMLAELNNGGYLTGISDDIRDANDYLYCTQKFVELNTKGEYRIESSKTYPRDDSKNGYARAYALAALGYKKSDGKTGAPNPNDERQWAWYYFDNETSTKNDLIEIALKYQEYKKAEPELTITNDSAKTEIIDNNVVYGPIYIQYLYVKAETATKTTGWGGFNYGFFDENGNNISNKINLCTKSNNGTYNNIQSTKISSTGADNGYYKVETNDYSSTNTQKVPLYIVTTDKTIYYPTIKIQSNTVDYTANVHHLTGTYDIENDGMNLCTSCRNSVTTSYSDAIGNEDAILKYDGSYYKWSKSVSERAEDQNAGAAPNDRLYLGEKIVTIGTSSKIEGTSFYYYKKSDGNYTTDRDAAYKTYLTSYGDGTYYCKVCSADSVYLEHAAAHSSTITYSDYWVRKYYFNVFEGCNKTLYTDKGRTYHCGTPYKAGDNIPSQSLLLIETASENKSYNEDAQLDIELTMSIPVKKVWNDDGNRDGIRPSSIQVTLYANGTKVTTGTSGEKITNPITLTKANNWVGEFTGLDRRTFEDGSVTYTIKEEGVSGLPAGYTVESITPKEISKTKGNPDVGFTITNKHEPETVKVTIKKEWNDDDNRDKIRPSSIQIKLWTSNDKGKTWVDVVAWLDENGNSVQAPNTITLNEANGWTFTTGELLKYYPEGVLKQFKLEEINVPEAYSVSYTSDTNTYTYTAVNTHEPEVVEIPITKIWDDESDRDGLRPESITVHLYSDDPKQSQPVQTATIKGTNTNDTWSYTFKSTDSQPIYKYRHNGVLINYRVEEAKIMKSQEYDSNQTYTSTKYTTSSTSQENASETCGTITGTTSYKSYRKNNVPETLSGFTIINIHIPEKVKVIVKKDWDDDSNRDAVRARELIFTLKADGNVATSNAYGDSITNPVTLNEGNKWTYTYENLYRYKDHGDEIEYTVEENITPEYYTQVGMTKTTDYSSGSQVITLSIKNKHELELVEFDVTKIWDDDTDRDGLRPESITLNLYADGKKVDSITINGTNTDNEWNGHFPSSDKVKLYKYKEGSVGVLAKYTIEEQTITNAQSYDSSQKYDAAKYTTSSTSGNTSSASTKSGSISGTTDYHDSKNNGKPQILSGFTVINKHTPEKMKVTVTKIWDDLDDLDEYRPASITCTLLSNENGSVARAKYAANGSSTNRSDVGDITVKDPISSGGEFSNTWGPVTVENLYRYYNHGTAILYTIEEKSIAHYNENDTHGDNKVKPESRVYYNGAGANAANPKIEITDCDYKDAKAEANKVTAITISNKHTPHYDGYVEITGKVWYDGAAGKGNDINGLMDSSESGLEGIKVTLKNADGTDFKCGDRTYTTKTDSNGNYTIRVNLDDTQKVYKMYESPESLANRLATAYVEFGYDGRKYTTVANKTPASNTSTAVENADIRKQFDEDNDFVDANTNPNNWEESAVVTADTVKLDDFKINGKYNQQGRDVTVKYCNGNGSYLQTNPDGAWKEILTSDKYMPSTEHPDHTTCSGAHSMSTFEIQVTKIQNVNLGLFEKEHPNVAIFSDLSKVEVEMLGQKYTYLYNIRSGEKNNVGLKVKFENKDTYTYRRPVNPADIAYINEKTENNNAMSVTVTYEVKIGNLSTTLPITVHSIANNFDPEYTLITSGWTATPGAQFNQAKNNADLNIKVEPQTESEAIYLTYTVSTEAIKGLLTDDATLNNAVEITSYSTVYGEKTLYAEQKTGGRTGQPYGGYDYNSHPGNAGIYFNEGTGRLEATKLEDDTDIAPSFVLERDTDYKVLSGNVWEDTDADNGSGPENLRVGDGKKAESEKDLVNAKVELYKVDDLGNVSEEPATLYKIVNGELSTKPAVAYSNGNGDYSFGINGEDDENSWGVMTDKYIIKFTYGVGIDGSITSTISGVEVDARNYKSTIISEGTELYKVFKGTSSSDEWHLNIGKGYSIAVDNLKERVNISDLQYSNFGERMHITARSKPFKMQVEFDAGEDKTSQVQADGKTLFGNELNVFDFGIIERAREDIFAEKTIEYLKITLANGQVLTEGDPTKQELRYAKPIGFMQTIDSGDAARGALDKQMSIEIDAELIQGAQLDVKYAIRVINNSEKDYDYYLGDQALGFDESKVRTEYYYYGTNNEESPEIKGSVNYLADYIDTDLTFQWENEGDWTEISANNLWDQGFISKNTKDELNAEKYKAFVTTKFSELQPGHSMTEYAYASRLLSNQDETVYENHMEILQIDAKTARTLKGKEDNGTPILKQYKMGNYVPSAEARVMSTDITKEEAGLHEQDDDRVKIIITTPTGITNYVIPYVIATLVGLIVIVVGVTFIKKKVLNK